MDYLGTPNCGKGQPSQVMYTGHGAAPARFKNIKVGVVKSGEPHLHLPIRGGKEGVLLNNMIGEKKLKLLAEQVLLLSTADETEVLLWVSENGLTRFANSHIHQNVSWEDMSISVRVIFEKIGVAGGNRLDPRRTGKIVRNAEAIARLQKEDPHFVSLPHPEKLPVMETDYFLDTVEERSRKVATIISAAKSKKLLPLVRFKVVCLNLL